MEDGQVDPHCTRISPATLDGTGIGRYDQATCKARSIVADIYNTRKKKSLANLFWPTEEDARPGAGIFSLQDVKEVGILFFQAFGVPLHPSITHTKKQGKVIKYRATKSIRRDGVSKGR